jgi:thiol-disulfide isomerase/thioredoxin
MRLALLICLALLGCNRSAEPQQDAARNEPSRAEEQLPTGKLDRSHRGEAAPATTFEDPDGEPTSLAEFSGKPVLVNLWATWCAPCVAEMPTLDALAERQGERLQVLAVSQDLDGREKVDAFFDKQGFRKLETWLDPKMELMAALKVDTLPTTILYDAGGREVWRVVGMEDWQSDRSAALLGEALSPGAAR